MLSLLTTLLVSYHSYSTEASEFKDFLNRGGQVDCGTGSSSRHIEIESADSEETEKFRIEFEIKKSDLEGHEFPRIQSADYKASGTTEEGLSHSRTLRVLFQRLPSVINGKEFNLIRNYGREGYGIYQGLPFARRIENKQLRYVSLMEPRYVQTEESEGGKLELKRLSQISEREQGLAKFTSRMAFEAFLHCKAEHKKRPKPKDWKEALKSTDEGDGAGSR